MATSRLRRRAAAGLMVLFLSAGADSARAQSSYAPEEAKPSALQRLDGFHKSLKRKLSRPFRKSSSDSQDQSEASAVDYADTQPGLLTANVGQSLPQAGLPMQTRHSAFDPTHRDWPPQIGQRATGPSQQSFSQQSFSQQSFSPQNSGGAYSMSPGQTMPGQTMTRSPAFEQHLQQYQPQPSGMAEAYSHQQRQQYQPIQQVQFQNPTAASDRAMRAPYAEPPRLTAKTNVPEPQQPTPPYDNQTNQRQGFANAAFPASMSSGNDAGYNAPTVDGYYLGNAQITATERALRLQSEIQELRNTQQSLLSQNRQLREELDATNSLLARVDAAMRDAEAQLREANYTNEELNQRIAEMEREHNQYLLQTDRMLESIRTELDDVLMREIAAAGK